MHSSLSYVAFYGTGPGSVTKSLSVRFLYRNFISLVFLLDDAPEVLPIIWQSTAARIRLFLSLPVGSSESSSI